MLTTLVISVNKISITVDKREACFFLHLSELKDPFFQKLLRISSGKPATIVYCVCAERDSNRDGGWAIKKGQL